MRRLRLKQSSVATGTYQIDLAFDADGQPERTASARVAFTLSTQDQEDLRWYLEDYLQFPFEPAPTIAAQVEARMAKIGSDLFKALFQSGEDTRDLWAKLRDRLNDTRVEIITPVQEAASIPWELLRDPKTDTPLALGAQAFVRSHTSSTVTPRLPAHASGPIRILLVICRPGGGNDVPFRSVASRLIKGLGQEARAEFQLDVLRPPTFAHLGKILRQAKTEGHPYHILHFDGHGVYGEESTASSGGTPNRHIFRRPGKHGFLAFEDSQVENNIALVDGPTLGKLLVETDVPVLALNACRSAHADTLDSDAPNVPQTAGEAGVADTVDPHAQVRALGSLAQEVIDAGVGRVVAMRYNVYVVTAAQFVADLYEALARGQTLGEAVSQGRKQLAAEPRRDIGYAPIDLQDWSVPVVYEAAPIALFPKPKRKLGSFPRRRVGKAKEPARDTLAAGVPAPPDTGFFGRDETLLALDRAFDRHHVVLLHAFAGSGKTSTAAEFARWYSLTGGVKGPVLFTSFEHKTTLFQALETLGKAFEPLLQQHDIQWQALTTTAERKKEALAILKQVSVLWIWDNVEPVAGFPRGTVSAWTTEEQQELADFLRAARETKARFLLTSRRDEREWLGDLPRRVALPRMPMAERMQLARALAEKQGKRLKEADWRPLLQFTEGNPLTVTVVVGQALQKGLTTPEQLAKFAEALRAGTVDFSDDESQGRSKSLGASLAYGFGEAFSEEEQKRLALLAFFQGFVNVGVLQAMGSPQVPWHLTSLEGVDRDIWIRLLDRAAEIGLLTGHGNGYYAIHPALPWFFQDLLTRYYPEGADVSEGESAEAACLAFVSAIASMATYYHRQYGNGNQSLIGVLFAEEANLRHAHQRARQCGRWRAVVAITQGLDILYNHLGRNAEWALLVEEIMHGLVDPQTAGPLPDLEEEWSLVTEYRVRLVREARDWDAAERLQRLVLAWKRPRATALLDQPVYALDVKQRNTLRSLAGSAHELGQILREQGRPECIDLYQESMDLAQRIGDQAASAVAAFNLGVSYLEVPCLHDLNQAQFWFQYTFDNRNEQDQLGRSKSLGMMGGVALEQFEEYRAANRPQQEVLNALNRALRLYSQALELCPKEVIAELAVYYNAIGVIFGYAGDIDPALRHYREAIRYQEQQGDLYRAAATRGNITLLLIKHGRFSDTLLYAQAALQNYQTFGERAASDIQSTQSLIAQIEQAQQSHK